MIKTIILLVIVFYTFPCRKINAQSRDTSNIFAGYYIAVYNKSDLSHKKIRRHHKHSYNTAIDSRYRTYFIPIKIGKNNINQENIWKEVTDNKTESDTIFIFPDSTDIKLFKQIGLIDSNISDKKHLLLQEIKSLPYYNTASNKAYLFKCLYVKGTFLQLRIDTIDKNWQDYLLDIYSISTKKKKKLLLVTGIDSLHSIKSDGTSIQARPYIKTGQQKPCTALIVGNWFAGEEGYIRKEALLEQGEPFVSWIRCNDCPQIRFNESNSGSVVYPGPPVSWNDPSNPDDPQAGYGYIPNDTTKEETFFYHSDHLGSTSYITDDHANITQYDAYLPYGELLVDEHSSSEDLPYKFNGKQFDEETGLYYYGARYMNPVTSLWYGVDPMAEKYMTIGAYVYCVSNPIRFLDLIGKEPGDFFESMDLAAIDFGKYYNASSIKENREYATLIYETKDRWGNIAYSYNTPLKGTQDSSKPSTDGLPKDAIVRAIAHTHGEDLANYDNENFSPTDIKTYKYFDGYVVTPKGKLKHYNHITKKQNIVATKRLPYSLKKGSNGRTKVIGNVYYHKKGFKTATERRVAWYKNKMKESWYDRYISSTLHPIEKVSKQ